MEKPKRSPQPSRTARGAGEMEADGKARGDKSESQRGDGERASQLEEATGRAGSGEFSCWPRALLAVEICQVVE